MAAKENVDGILIEAPAKFVKEETMVSLRVPARAGTKDARIQNPLRPNLIVHRRLAGARADLAAVVARTREELARSIPGLSPVESADVAFDDGVTGVLLAYSFPAPKGLRVCQLQALRLDDGTVTSLTVTAEQSQMTEAAKKAFLRALASASLER